MSVKPPKLAVRLAQARQQRAATAGLPGWDELSEEEQDGATLEANHYLEAAAAAGILFAAVDAEGLSPPARVTAMVRGIDDRPLDRDTYASHLQARADRGLDDDRLALLSEEEAQAIAGLLDELAGVDRGEPLGQLARGLAVRTYDRLEA
jgi:hypothetical protein